MESNCFSKYSMRDFNFNLFILCLASTLMELDSQLCLCQDILFFYLKEHYLICLINRDYLGYTIIRPLVTLVVKSIAGSNLFAKIIIIKPPHF